MTRNEHLEWCKKRALDYVNQGDVIKRLCDLMNDDIEAMTEETP